jgi:hypothetical protein
MLRQGRSSNQFSTDPLRMLANSSSEFLAESNNFVIVPRSRDPAAQLPDVFIISHRIFGTLAQLTSSCRPHPLPIQRTL